MSDRQGHPDGYETWTSWTTTKVDEKFLTEFSESSVFRTFEIFENKKGIVSINDRLPNGWTALHFAVEENKIKMARFIIDYGAEIEGISIEKFLTRTGFQTSF